MCAAPAGSILPLLTGYWVSQAIYVAAKLGLADLIGDEPRTAEQLAAATSTHAPSLYRLLRGLASVGVFREEDGHRFALTPAAEGLKSGPDTQRSLAIMMGEEHYASWGELLYSIQTGKTAFDKLHGAPVFDWLTQQPDKAKIFDEAMVGVHGRETEAMLDAYDFAGIQVLADVGGGNGSVLRTVLKRHARLRGMLCDLQNVVDRAQALIAADGLAGRLQTYPTNFFKAVPPGADAYLMRHIIHDWNDDQALEILKNIRRVIAADGRLLVIETVIPPGNDPGFGKLLDLNMLVIPGGKERTAEEYRELFAAGGFRLSGITPTRSEVSIIEGRPL